MNSSNDDKNQPSNHDDQDTAAAALTILFATQSGRAKACARRTARILTESGYNVKPPMSVDNSMGEDDWSSFNNKKKTVLFFVSTTGDGEQTDSIQKTWKRLLQKSLPPNLFEGMSFALFCLGDRAYGEQFCAAGRKLAVRLLQLSATLLGEVGYGDDGTPNGGVFVDLDDWLPNLLDALKAKFGDDMGNPTVASRPLIYPHKVSINAPSGDVASLDMQWKDEAYTNFFEHVQPLTAYQFESIVANGDEERLTMLEATLISNERLTAPDWEQDTRHLRLRVKANGTYAAGDVAAILPRNSAQNVQRFLDVLPEETRILADHELAIEGTNDSPHPLFFSSCTFWPHRCTLRGWLTFCADICALPEREDLRALALHCSLNHDNGSSQCDKLLGLSETSEAALYADYVLREKRSWVDVLYDFDSLRAPGSKLTLEALLALMSPLRPREFSIASSPTKERLSRNKANMSSTSSETGFHVELCVAVVEGTTPLGRHFHGLCSHYLAQLEPSAALRMWIRPGTFQDLDTHVDESTGLLEKPLLCIGAGTGVAPLRGLILEREAVRQVRLGDMMQPSLSLVDLDNELCRDNILVFGCRKEAADFYYNAEWKALQDAGRLCLLTAFSRDQWHKIYVQQVLNKADDNRRLIALHLLEKGGTIYIAGGPKMARAIKDEIVESLAKEVGDEKRAKQVLANIQRQGRFSIEAWS